MLYMELHLPTFNYSIGILIKSVAPSHNLCPLSKNVFFGIKKKKTITFVSLFRRLFLGFFPLKVKTKTTEWFLTNL